MFALRLKELRAERDISQRELARALNVSIGAIGNWESRTRMPDAEKLQQIADFFDVSVDYLLGRTDAKNNSATHKKGVIVLVNIDKIKILAKEQGIKIKFICSQLSLAEGYLSNVQSGKTVMTDERLEKIAEILHTTPEYLRDETDDPSAAPANADNNVVIVRGRDGSFSEKKLTDEQMKAVQAIIDQLPDA